MMCEQKHASLVLYINGAGFACSFVKPALYAFPVEFVATGMQDVNFLSHADPD